jgi:integrase
MDFREIGKHLPRTKWGEGWVEKRGKRRKVWVGFWYDYVLIGDHERRRTREKVLGTIEEIGESRRSAMSKLRELRAQMEGADPSTASPNPTVAKLWEGYRTIKAERWSKIMENALVSTFKTCVLPAIGDTPVTIVTATQLQGLLNALAKAGRSHSAIKKAKTHLKAMFELAVDDKLLDASPARRLTMPKRIRRVDDSYADEIVVRRLFDAAGRRDQIILRLFVSCGLRPQEAFALRGNDIEPGRLRVDEALKQAERGSAFIGEPKTVDAYGYVALPAKLESELRSWIRDEHITPDGWLFPASRGTGPIRPNNYVKRDLARLALAAGVGPIDLRRLRRTCATYLRDEAVAQSQLRHSSVETTRRHYLKAIPADQKARVDRLDQEFFGSLGNGPNAAPERPRRSA